VGKKSAKNSKKFLKDLCSILFFLFSFTGELDKGIDPASLYLPNQLLYGFDGGVGGHKANKFFPLPSGQAFD